MNTPVHPPPSVHNAPHCSNTEHLAVTRRDWLRWSMALPISALTGIHALSATPSAWPIRPIQLIVPWPAGGATDLTLRVLCEEVQPLLGQPIVVINRPGAAGTQVAPALKAAEPDGYTLGQVPITVYRHALMNHVPWDPTVDLSPIVQVSGTTFGLLVPANSPWRHFRDLLGWARQNPGALLLGSTGIGTTAHLAMEEILLQEHIRYVHVPYRGTADQMLAIASGQLMAGVNSTGFAPWLDDGKLRLLGIFSAERSVRWPDAPTFKELGYPHSVYTSPWGIAAPRGTPENVIRKLHDAFARAMRSERHVRELARYDQTLEYLNTQDYRRTLRDTVQNEHQLLRRMNLLAPPRSGAQP